MPRIFVLTVFVLNFIVSSAFAVEEKNEKVVKSLSFDSKTAAVSYELTHPAKIRIRIGTKDGPLLRTIVDWQERTTGAHKEEWDGFDLTGKERLTGNHDLVFTFNYFTEDDSFLKNVSTRDIMPLPEQVIIGRFLPSLDINRIHKSHNSSFCHEPELIAALPKGTHITKDGYAIIKEKTRIVFDIAEKDNAWFSRERYSIHIFIDDVFLSGELEGYSPYNFIFDPKNINAGRHLLTVNYSGFSDHIGILSIPVYVRKKENSPSSYFSNFCSFAS